MPHVWTIRKTDAEDFDRLHRASDPFEPRVRRLWESLPSKFAREISLADLSTAVRLERIGPVNDAIANVYAALGADLEPLLAGGAMAAGGAVMDDLGISLSFDLLNPRAALFARQRSSTLIKEVTRDQREAVRKLIFKGITSGDAPRVVAREVQQVVGLHSRQIVAARNFRTAQLEQLIRQHPRTAVSVLEARAQKNTQRFIDRQLKERAMTIARTEMNRASNVGQREAWDAAKKAGLLDTDKAVRVWIAAIDSRTDDVCSGLDGVTVPYDEEFSEGEPPIHPRCRCTIGLRRATANP